MDDLVAALEKHAWDGAWYLRAFYDDGTPLGSARSLECKIDSIAQSWGVISGAANSERATRAMQAVREQLVRADDRLILLFTPPFDDSPQDPGYIKGYVPGIRENGGQYTHAALWTIWAFALLQRPEEAARLLDIVNPVRHADTPDKVAIYQVEPYVVAADVYSVAPHTGRGGWTWYTGSAAWMYRLVLEMILGIQRRGDTLMINPVLPPAWDGFRAEYRFGEAVYKLDIQADDSADTPQIWLNGDRRAGHDIPLHDNHQVNSVVVRVGRAPEPRLLSEQGDSAS
jgi:cellobiose phosphorylase